jgi:hypothetical protein
MRVPLLSQLCLNLRRRALLTEIEMHAESIRDLGHAMLELSDQGDELSARVLALLEALDGGDLG